MAKQKKKKIEPYCYWAKVDSVYDGDTIKVTIDVGFQWLHKTSIRILGIDTPEIRTRNKEEKKAGYAARYFLAELIEGKDVLVRTHKPDKFGGRWLGDVETDDGTDVAKLMIKKGHARPYFGKKKQPWVF